MTACAVERQCRSELCPDTGVSALRAIAEFLGVPLRPPEPDAEIALPREMFMGAIERLAELGVPMHPDAEASWRSFRRLRTRHEPLRGERHLSDQVAERLRALEDGRRHQRSTSLALVTASPAPAPHATGSWFPVPEEDAVAPELEGLFAKLRERLGFVPNVFRVYAFRPRRLSAWFGHFRQLHEATEGLTAADREMVAVVVSAANGCLYCLVAHGAALREELGDPVLGERISYDWRRAGLSARRRAICAYAEKLTLRPREVTRDDLQSLLDAGLTPEEAWDVAELAAMYNLTNRMAMATNMLPNPEYSAAARPDPA